MNLRNIKPTFFLSLALIGSFFLPWISFSAFGGQADMPGYSSGWTLPIRINDSSWMANFLLKDFNSLWLKLLYVFYAIPFIAAFNIYKRLNRQRPAINEFFLGLIGAASLFFYLRLVDMKINNTLVEMLNKGIDLQLYKLLSIGYFVLLIASILGLYFSVVKEVDDYMSFEEEMEYEYPASQEPAVTSIQPRADIYKQLEQLHSLYEKGILSKEHYEHERDQLLQQLPSKGS
jgi:hypothetical protein